MPVTGSLNTYMKQTHREKDSLAEAKKIWSLGGGRWVGFLLFVWLFKAAEFPSCTLGLVSLKKDWMVD